MTTTSRNDLIEEIRRRTGLDEARIAWMVHAFYRRVRADEVLGPIFAAEIADGDLSRISAHETTGVFCERRMSGSS
ncbi:hypothetical protein [Rubellimicrobium roseum]|uniref:hypothetical protein n=1 Tax=Rubellimicrobium roseum TaxID=687525 RepID=UPI00159BE749|nr:hypothetical protein [Rubellimicrobium roseum]